MKFSVVIPVYNTEEFLPRCLDSLKAQTDSDFEVVVVDDCSPGGTARPESAPYRTEAIVSRYDSRFRSIRHEKNRGAFQARCTGVTAAKGDYIVPLDPDDYLLSETLERVRAVLDRESPDMVTYWIDCDDGRKVWPHWCRHPSATTSAEEMLREMVRHKTMYSIVSKVVRREVYQRAIEELHLPEAYVNTSEDFLATLAILLCGRRVSHLDYAGYRYFSNPDSITANRRTAAGFRRACEQSRLVYDAVRAMAERISSNSARNLIEDVIALSEGWFCTEVVEGPTDQIWEFAQILFDIFDAQTVGRAFAEAYAKTATSRSYRAGKLFMRLLWGLRIVRR